jgi:manganese/zinc/iron transport system permease protein
VSPTLAIVTTGVLVAASCSLLGTFLVLRRLAMMTDAIAHAVLPGLVVGYALAGGPNLALAFLGAATSSLVLVFLVDRFGRSDRVDSQAAIGVSFSAMFALGTFLVTRFFSDVHLDTDAVLYGNIEFVGFDRLFLGGTDLGPRAVWVMGALCLLNLAFVILFAKELEVTTFDPALAAALGFSPVVVHYALMALVSATAVGAFTAVGAILVVALMVVPSATALLLSARLRSVMALSVVIGAASAVLGYVVAAALDTSVSGMMATMTGVFFLVALLASPRHGLVSRRRRARRARAALLGRVRGGGAAPAPLAP